MNWGMRMRMNYIYRIFGVMKTTLDKMLTKYVFILILFTLAHNY